MKPRVIDSHTAGEPTRVVISGGPELGPGSMAQRLEFFRREHDRFRAAVIDEPRGYEALVGALLCEPTTPDFAAGVIFFNNVGYLGMCGHGTIGLIVTLAHLARIGVGEHWIETPVGPVATWLHEDGAVTVRNVPAYRSRKGVTVDVAGFGEVTGDVGWGGNWFFLIDWESHAQLACLPLDLEHRERLIAFCKAVRVALERDGIHGADGHQIDHIEIFASPRRSDADSRNFVLCPGGAYDRSPCGTGLSAKLACLHADGKLPEGQVWRQEGLLGGIFEGFVRADGQHLYPHIKGHAFITAEATLHFDPRDELAGRL